MIRLVTQNRYNHCSICLKEDLSKFYSFARLYRRYWVLSGFVVESPCRYTLNSSVLAKVAAVPVDDESFENIRRMIAYMKDHSDEYVYNFFSAAVYPLGRRFERRNAFTCAEFTYKVLELAGIKLPDRANIEQMERALAGYPTWEGRAVDSFFGPGWGDDQYLDPPGRCAAAVQAARRLKRLVLGRA